MKTEMKKGDPCGSPCSRLRPGARGGGPGTRQDRRENANGASAKGRPWASPAALGGGVFLQALACVGELLEQLGKRPAESLELAGGGDRRPPRLGRAADLRPAGAGGAG